MIQLKSREVVGSNSKLNGCGNVIDVCCDNVFNVREWNAVDAKDLYADGRGAMGSGETRCEDGLK